MLIDCTAVRNGRARAADRTVPQEVPVALVYDATTHAVLMATPADLADLGRGFSLTEGIVDDLAQIEALDVVVQPDGVEVRMWLRGDAGRAHLARRRAIVGRTGCGLCGVESLAQALPPLTPVTSGARWSVVDFTAAVGGLCGNQPLGAATRAVHAAGLWHRGALVAVREDVGRHNALDKLAGALDGAELEGAIVVLTSRVSVEMVQKTARMGVAGIAAISAPTALAVRVAEAAGITLAAVVRGDGFEVFSGTERLIVASQ